MVEVNPSGDGSQVSIDNAYQTLQEYVQGQDKDVAQASEAAKSGTTGDTLDLEMAIQRWSLSTSLESEVIKSIASALRSIIRNISTE